MPSLETAKKAIKVIIHFYSFLSLFCFDLFPNKSLWLQDFGSVLDSSRGRMGFRVQLSRLLHGCLKGDWISNFERILHSWDFTLMAIVFFLLNLESFSVI